LEDSIQKQAGLVAKRVNGDAVGIDMATVLRVLMEVLKTAIACYSSQVEGVAEDPSKVYAQIRKDHANNPDKLRKRTMRRVRAEATEMMSKAQAFAIADAIIEQALSVDEETCTICCRISGGIPPAETIPPVPAPVVEEVPSVTPEVIE
jgi:hypothetical protein